jgi:probable phosphoglycerate mutase
MSTVYLIRHGEIIQSHPRRFVGRQDLPLTDRGREQISRLADILATRSIARVLSSPLTRCVESADILCSRLGGAPELVPDFCEISLGDWEGLSIDEVRDRFPGRYEARGLDPAGFRPSGGESFHDLLHRAWPAFETVVKAADDGVAIMAHAGVNRVLLCRILDMPLENLFRLGQDYGCLNIVHHDRSGLRVENINFRH